MDWFSWLSQTELEPSLVYEYGLLFAQNEVEEEDMTFFNHDFLQTMGIGVAKHRLEILKLAKRERGRAPYVHRLFSSLKKTNRRVRKYVNTWLQQNRAEPGAGAPACVSPSRAIFPAAVYKDHRHAGSLGCFPHLAMRNRLLIASGNRKSPLRLKGTPEKSYTTTPKKDNQVLPANSADVWWASMFENLKPT